MGEHKNKKTKITEDQKAYWLNRAKDKLTRATDLIMEVNEHLRHIESPKRFKLIAEDYDPKKAVQDVMDWAGKMETLIKEEEKKKNADTAKKPKNSK